MVNSREFLQDPADPARVVAGEFVFYSAVLGVDVRSGPPTDLGSQVLAAVDNLESLLLEDGLDLSALVSARLFLRAGNSRSVAEESLALRPSLRREATMVVTVAGVPSREVIDVVVAIDGVALTAVLD